MKTLDNSKDIPQAEVPIVSAIPISSKKNDSNLAEVIPVRPAFSNAETAIVFFLRQFRVLVGAARLYQRNHPRLMEILASTEQQLRIALAARRTEGPGGRTSAQRHLLHAFHPAHQRGRTGFVGPRD
jgi:hypothetical protein